MFKNKQNKKYSKIEIKFTYKFQTQRESKRINWNN